MFESLSDRLNDTFGRLGRKGRLTEADVDEAMREVRRALLEADVNFKVVKDFVAAVRELRAKPGGELQVVGSLSLARLLLDQDLVDELTLLTFPVVVEGQLVELEVTVGDDDLDRSMGFPEAPDERAPTGTDDEGEPDFPSYCRWSEADGSAGGIVVQSAQGIQDGPAGHRA